MPSQPTVASLPQRSSYDVVIVGARAAGASTAMLLARAGLSVLLVDRGRYGTDTVSTHALMRGGVRQLSRWGLLEYLREAGTRPITQVRFHYPDGDVTVPVRPAHGVEALYAPRRTVLDPGLVDAAARAGAEVCYGLAVTGLEFRRRVVGVRVRTRSGPDVAVGAGLVVGADGLRSTVAAAAGAPVYHEGRAAGAYVYGYWSGVSADGYEWAYGPGATAGFIPTNDGQLCVFAGSTPDRVGRGGPFSALLARASPDLSERLAEGTPLGNLRTFPGRPGYLRQAWGPGWALVGDAGSWKDPISTHGLTDALRDAELLASAVLASRRDGIEERRAFTGYQQTRDRLTAPLLALSDEIAAYQWDDDTIRRLVRGLSDAMNAGIEAMDELSVGPVGSLPDPGPIRVSP